MARPKPAPRSSEADHLRGTQPPPRRRRSPRDGDHGRLLHAGHDLRHSQNEVLPARGLERRRRRCVPAVGRAAAYGTGNRAGTAKSSCALRGAFTPAVGEAAGLAAGDDCGCGVRPRPGRSVHVGARCPGYRQFRPAGVTGLHSQRRLPPQQRVLAGFAWRSRTVPGCAATAGPAPRSRRPAAVRAA